MSAPPVDVRPRRLDDPVSVALVAALDAELVERYAGDADVEGEPDHAFLNVLHGDVAPPLGAFLVAFVDGEPAGCGAVRPHRDEEGTAEIKRMFVAPHARGRGVGRAILAALEVEAARLGYGRAVLETGIRQPEAIALYGATGWTPIPNYGAYRRSTLSRCFEKALSPPPAPPTGDVRAPGVRAR